MPALGIRWLQEQPWVARKLQGHSRLARWLQKRPQASKGIAEQEQVAAELHKAKMSGVAK